MKTPLLFLSGVLLLSTFAHAGEFLRTSTIHTNGETFKVDVKLNYSLKTSAVESKTYLKVMEDPCEETRYACVTEVTAIAKDALRFTVKDANGNLIEEKSQDAELIASREVEASEGTECQPLIQRNEPVNFLHPNQFISFKVNGNDLALSVVFTGNLNPARSNESSLQSMNWFFNNTEGRGSAQLIDPNAPVEEYDYEWDH